MQELVNWEATKRNYEFMVECDRGKYNQVEPGPKIGG